MVQLGDFRLSLPPEMTSQDSIIMGIRPEHVRLPKADDQQTIRGDVFSNDFVVLAL
jgi:multiple sugar transport system ATP-binding protein